MKLNKRNLLTTTLAASMLMTAATPAFAQQSRMPQSTTLEKLFSSGKEKQKTNLQNQIDEKKKELEQVNMVLNMGLGSQLLSETSLFAISTMTVTLVAAGHEMHYSNKLNPGREYVQEAMAVAYELEKLAGKALVEGYDTKSVNEKELSKAQRQVMLDFIKKTEEKMGKEELEKMVAAVLREEGLHGHGIFLIDSPQIKKAAQLAMKRTDRLRAGRVGIMLGGAALISAATGIGGSGLVASTSTSSAISNIKNLLDEGRVTEAQDVVDGYKADAIKISLEIKKLQTELNALNGAK